MDFWGILKAVESQRKLVLSPPILVRLSVAFLIIGYASASVSASSSTSSSSSQSRPPNFIVLFMDDLGYGDLGFTGHPTALTPNLDSLAHQGKILTTWYSGCMVCSGSRAALLTGRQFPRAGVPGVYEPVGNAGLPLSEITIAQHLRDAGYATAAVGKWHLGQRPMYLPAIRGFDYYLGIPYSDDMGDAIASACPSNSEEASGDESTTRWRTDSMDIDDDDTVDDPARHHLPLLYQDSKKNYTRILEQPLDFTHLAEHYRKFAIDFIMETTKAAATKTAEATTATIYEHDQQSPQPFFLYVPFSHVHTTSNSQPHKQYAGCQWKNSTRRGPYGDALREADELVGSIFEKLQELDLESNTLILFTSDNGPWLEQGLSAGTSGLLTGQYAGYSNTGKGSTWEGGIRMPAFAYWKGMIEPFSRSSEIVSSLDVFPTLSRLAGVPLPSDADGRERVFDGRDMTDILLKHNGQSMHDFLFFYGSCRQHKNNDTDNDSHHRYSVTAVRHGSYKAHWCTGPGLGGDKSLIREYHPYPLLFNVDHDPAESMPLSKGNLDLPSDPQDRAALERIVKAYAFERATFTYGSSTPEPDLPDEGPGRYGVCCDRSRACNCNNIGDSKSRNNYNHNNDDDGNIRVGGLFSVGTKRHHDAYHEALSEPEPSPPRTQIHRALQEKHRDHD